MEVTPQKNPSKGEQFRLVKYFAYASFIVLIIFSFPFSVVVSQQAKDILIKSYEDNALLLGESLNHQVFQNFHLPVLGRFGRIRLSEKEQYEVMDRVVKNAILVFPVDLVNIYDILNNVISYSTDPKLIGLKVRPSLGYNKAVNGESSSGMISSGDDYWGLGIEVMGGRKKLKTYIPYKVVYPPYVEEEHVSAVFELTHDMTKQYESIVKFQYLIFGLSILIMGLIFVVLLLIVHRAERIIEQRAQEQRELEEQLNQAEHLAAIGEMVAGVSHEIKNPLGIIQSTAELLGETSNASESHKRLSRVITEESSRLNRIVTEFLDFARPQMPNLKECYLEEIILKNLSFLSPEMEKRGILISDNLNGRTFRMRADHELIYRALLNIFINAMQSMKDPGTINVRVDVEMDTYRIEIQDAGCGITQENQKKIFNPFFTTKETGSGLGLSIVRKIIEGHEGTIVIESREGTGTKVTLQLPRKI
jgi:signal transduction histidine kinase